MKKDVPGAGKDPSTLSHPTTQVLVTVLESLIKGKET